MPFCAFFRVVTHSEFPTPYYSPTVTVQTLNRSINHSTDAMENLKSVAASKSTPLQEDTMGSTTTTGTCLTAAHEFYCTGGLLSLYAPTGAREGLALVTELLSEPLAFGQLVAASTVNAVSRPPLHSCGPSVGGHSNHVRAVGLAEVIPRDGVPPILRRRAEHCIVRFMATQSWPTTTLTLAPEPSEISLAPAVPLRLSMPRGKNC